MSEKIVEAIRESSLFRHLDTLKVATLMRGGSLQVYSQGARIIEEDGPVESLHLILSGRVRVWTHGMSGEIELKTLGPGSYFGEVSLLSGKEATATVEVTTGPAQIVALPREGVLALMNEDENVRRTLEGVTLARAKDTLGKVMK